MIVNRVDKAALVVLALLLFSGVSLAQDQPPTLEIDNITQDAVTAKKLTAVTVPAIRLIVLEADQLLETAIRTDSLIMAVNANRLYEKAIRLSRTELLLRRELRGVLVRLKRMRREVNVRPGGEGPAALRAVEGHLIEIRQNNAFRDLEHFFIRRQVNLAKQALGRAKRAANRKVSEKPEERTEGALKGRGRTEGASEEDKRAASALARCKRLRTRVVRVVSGKVLPRALVVRSDGILAEARRLLDQGQFTESRSKSRLAERLYQRALTLASKESVD